ncbi:MAG: hypothetical protein Ct9H300mP5_2830 [Candidatus Pelagibacterales bacterium]|nr:MAG: hypothetical protein Ct9H300mP5_2830 [Pelagibacterales bacterium]
MVIVSTLVCLSVSIHVWRRSFKGLPARAIHLGFALLLAFLIFPLKKKNGKIGIVDVALACMAFFACIYIYFFYDQIVDRGGILLDLDLNFLGSQFVIPIELIIGSFGILHFWNPQGE